MKNKTAERRNVLSPEQQALFEIRRLRQLKQERRAPDRVLQFEEGVAIKTIAYNDMVKEITIQSPDQSEQTFSEPITPEEKGFFDAMLDIVEAYENAEFDEPGPDDDFDFSIEYTNLDEELRELETGNEADHEIPNDDLEMDR